MAKYIADESDNPYRPRVINSDAEILKFDVQSNPITMWTEGGQEINDDWEYTDPNGHFHNKQAYWTRTKQQGEEEWCERCRDYHKDFDSPRVCIDCGAEIEPESHYVGPHQFTVQGSIDVQVTFDRVVDESARIKWHDGKEWRVGKVHPQWLTLSPKEVSYILLPADA